MTDTLRTNEVPSLPSDAQVKQELSLLAWQYRQLCDKATLVAVGRKVRIVSDFNGQPYGRSKKSLRGKILTINSVHLYQDDRVSFCCDDPSVQAGFDMLDMEFV